MVPQHPDQHYIEAIRSGEPAALRSLIGSCYPPVKAWICQNSGTEADAQDVFGDALEAVCRKLHRGEPIELTARFSTYMFSICKFQWLKQLRKKGKGEVRLEDEAVLNLEAAPWEQDLEESERMQFFRRKFLELSESCRRLLELCWSEKRKPMAEIAERMGFGSVNYASKRKYQCLEKLKEIVRADPDFDEYV